jgi:hypothetical protein
MRARATGFILVLVVAIAGCVSPSHVPEAPKASTTDADIAAMVAGVTTERISADLASLVAFHTRNTCSTVDDAARGIGAARDYVRKRFESLGLRVALASFEAPCAETVTRQSVIGTIAGRDPRRLVLLGAHYDSRTLERNDGTSDAPGANDSGSQTALLLEAARVMSGHTYDVTVAFVAFAGEEQGLLGSKSVAKDLDVLFPGAVLEAMFDCDIVGGDSAANDDTSLHELRLYAPGAPRETRADAPDGTPDGTSPSRRLQRYVAVTTPAYVPDMSIVPKLREDRPGRGGDHEPFIELGYPAVRFIESRETLAHQHSSEDTLAYVTPAYTARVTRVVVSSLASLARAPRAPAAVAVTRDETHVVVTWNRAADASRSMVLARGAGEHPVSLRLPVSSSSRFTFALREEALAPPFFVTVSAVDAAGHESLAAPEWRCDEATCAVPIKPEDITRKL